MAGFRHDFHPCDDDGAENGQVATSRLSITLVPVLMTVFLRGHRLRPEAKNPMAQISAVIYRVALAAALRWRWATLAINFAVIPLMIPVLFVIGSEFMPPLYEGSLLGACASARHARNVPAGPAGSGGAVVSESKGSTDGKVRWFDNGQRFAAQRGMTLATDWKLEQPQPNPQPLPSPEPSPAPQPTPAPPQPSPTPPPHPNPGSNPTA